MDYYNHSCQNTLHDASFSPGLENEALKCDTTANM